MKIAVCINDKNKRTVQKNTGGGGICFELRNN